MRLWGKSTEFVGFILQSLVLRCTELGWILIYRDWSITYKKINCKNIKGLVKKYWECPRAERALGISFWAFGKGWVIQFTAAPGMGHPARCCGWKSTLCFASVNWDDNLCIVKGRDTFRRFQWSFLWILNVLIIHQRLTARYLTVPVSQGFYTMPKWGEFVHNKCKALFRIASTGF